MIISGEKNSLGWTVRANLDPTRTCHTCMRPISKYATIYENNSLETRKGLESGKEYKYWKYYKICSTCMDRIINGSSENPIKSTIKTLPKPTKFIYV